MSRSRPARGIVVEPDGMAYVHVPDAAEANRLYNKGAAGAPQTDNSLRMTLAEAAYALQAGRLEVEGYDLAALLRLPSGNDVPTETEYLAYADLRERGLVVQSAAAGYQVWHRGQGPKREPWFRVHIVHERTPVNVGTLRSLAGGVLAVVDEDGVVTHYTLAREHPEGDVDWTGVPVAAGLLLVDRVLVQDPAACAAMQACAMGTPHGEARILSLTEAEALRRAGHLDIADLSQHAEARQHHFPRTLPVYEALRTVGAVPRSGFRFGTHLRAYASNPDTIHAEWLVQCALEDDRLHWSEISRGVRLAHGVRKRFLVAVPHEAGVDFLHLAWFRP